MPGGKGDQWIRGLLAQSVEQLKEKSGRVEDARTARQREHDRLARLRGEVRGSGQVEDSQAARQTDRLAREREDASGRDLDSRQKEDARLATKLREGGSQTQRLGERTRLVKRGQMHEKKDRLKSSHHLELSTKTAVGSVGGKEVVGVEIENIEASAVRNCKKLKLAEIGEEQRVNIENLDEKEDVVFIAVKEKKTQPVEVIDIEDPSNDEEIPRKKKKKKKDKTNKRKRKQEKDARFYKNPLFDLSNGNVRDITGGQSEKTDPSLINTSVVSMGTRFDTECERSMKGSQEESMSEVNSNRSSSESHKSTSSASTKLEEEMEGSAQRSISKSIKSMKKTYSAGGRKRIFTQEEDAVILSALPTEGAEFDFVSLAKDLGRSQASVRSRFRKLQAGDTKKRRMAFALSEDKAIIDMVFPYVDQVLEGRVPNREWLRMAEEMCPRRCQSLRSRWEHYLKPWILQNQAGTLNLSINNLLLAHLVSSYSSIDAIAWSEVAKMKEFVGHTESSLRSLFYSKLYKNAQNTLGKDWHLVTLKEVAEVEESRVKDEKISRGVEERQAEVIKYWLDRKKMTLVDSLLQEEKKNLLQRKAETLKEVQSPGGLGKKQVNLVKEKQKKDRAGGKKHFQPLPRLDHKHNKWLARDADVYNLHQPVLAQASSYFKSQRSNRS